MAIETPKTRLVVDGVLIKVLVDAVEAYEVPSPPGIIYTLNAEDLAFLEAENFKYSIFFAETLRDIFVCDGTDMHKVSPSAITDSDSGDQLTISTIDDGQFLMRSGNSIIGAQTMSTRSDTFTATGNGTAVDMSALGASKFSIQVTMTGTVTSWDVRLEGSLDGVTYTTILTHTNVTPGDGLMVYNGDTVSPALYFRSRCAGLVLGVGTNIIVKIVGMV